MSSRSSHEVRVLQKNEIVILPDSLARSAGFVGLESWLTFVHKVYDFPVYRIVSRMDDTIDGWLALVRVQHPIFGNYLTTSPAQKEKPTPEARSPKNLETRIGKEWKCPAADSDGLSPT